MENKFSDFLFIFCLENIENMKNTKGLYVYSFL